MATKKVMRTSSQAPEQNFTEITESTLQQNSLEVSVNAKGFYQYSVKFAFSSPEEVAEYGTRLAAEFDQRFRAKFPTPNRSE